MTTWVFAEEVDGAPSGSALEALSKAREWGGEVAAFYVGTGGDAPFGELGAHGATKVYHLDTGDLLPAAAAASFKESLMALAPTAEPQTKTPSTTVSTGPSSGWRSMKNPSGPTGTLRIRSSPPDPVRLAP